jgi:hypothetical protein
MGKCVSAVPAVQPMCLGPELSSMKSRSSRVLSALQPGISKFSRAKSGERRPLRVIGSSDFPDLGCSSLLGYVVTRGSLARLHATHISRPLFREREWRPPEPEGIRERRGDAREGTRARGHESEGVSERPREWPREERGRQSRDVRARR